MYRTNGRDQPILTMGVKASEGYDIFTNNIILLRYIYKKWKSIISLFLQEYNK